MRDYLAKYNRTNMPKTVKLVAQKLDSELKDSINLILQPDGYFPLHVDVLLKEFEETIPKRENRIYFIQDVYEIDPEEMETVDPNEDQIIFEAIELLNDPQVKEILEQAALEEAEREQNEESQSE